MKLVLIRAMFHQVGPYVFAELLLSGIPEPVPVVHQRDDRLLVIGSVTCRSRGLGQCPEGFFGCDLRQGTKHITHRDPVRRVADFNKFLVGRQISHFTQTFDDGILSSFLRLVEVFVDR